jgi:hypothetical protein
MDEAAFRDLVGGKIVKLRTAGGEEVEIILSDIGWGLMLKAVHEVMEFMRDMPEGKWR